MWRIGGFRRMEVRQGQREVNKWPPLGLGRVGTSRPKQLIDAEEKERRR